jgi:hypothetical protein
MQAPVSTGRSQSSIHWPSVLQFGLSLIATFTLWALALSLALIGILGRYNPEVLPGEVAQLTLLAAGMFLIGALLVPSAVYALLRLIGRPGIRLATRQTPWFIRPTILIMAFPLVLFAGEWVIRNTTLEWILLPPLHLLAVGLPLLWLVYLGKRGLKVGSPQRKWGILGSGLVLGPLLIMILEIVAVLVLVTAALLYISTQPQLANEIMQLVQRLSQAPPTPQIIQRIVVPYLYQPGVVYTVFVFGAVIVPLIEELLKPIGVWLLAGSDITPRAGFVAGLLCGAGFALLENMAFASSLENWALLVIGRFGTGVIHIFTAGLTGWALAFAWQQRRYLRLGVAYLAAVLLHGLWNGLAILSLGAQLAPDPAEVPTFVLNLAAAVPFGLGFMALSTFVLLLWANRSLRGNQLTLT